MVSKIYSGVAIGIQGMVICVEADISPGLPTMNLVGYLSSSVKEAGDRVRTALRNTGFSIPPSMELCTNIVEPSISIRPLRQMILL